MDRTRPVTLINVIDVEPERCDEVVQTLSEGLDAVIAQRPGFLSATVHVSTDHRRVINVATWARAEDATATAQDPAAAPFAARVAELGRPTAGLFTTAHSTAG